MLKYIKKMHCHWQRKERKIMGNDKKRKLVTLEELRERNKKSGHVHYSSRGWKNMAKKLKSYYICKSSKDNS